MKISVIQILTLFTIKLIKYFCTSTAVGSYTAVFMSSKMTEMPNVVNALPKMNGNGGKVVAEAVDESTNS